MLDALNVLLGQGFVISIVSTVIAVVAFIFSLRGAHRDRINTNSRGTYSHHSEYPATSARSLGCGHIKAV